MSQSLITSRVWRLRKRLTKSDGASAKTLLIFSYRLMVWFLAFLLTIDKTIKLWKVCEKSIKAVSVNNLSDGAAPPSLTSKTLKLPKLIHHDSMTAAVPKKIYQNAHTYHIHSLSLNSDQETFLSADDLRINLWNLGISDQSFSTLPFKISN